MVIARKDVSLRRVLPAHASSVGQARVLVRDALGRAGAGEWEDAAQIAVSELVTNALVHAGSPVRVEIQIDQAGLRVQVADESPHQPRRRDYSSTSGTGRGLKLLDEYVTSWGSYARGGGKVVWFELRSEESRLTRDGPWAGSGGGGSADEVDRVEVELLNVPLLMHAAWQEHASALLREYLLVRVQEADTSIFASHARASDAMSLLQEQIPAPEVGEDPNAVMARASEPGVSRDRLVLRLPAVVAENFSTLEELLEGASDLADTGALLVPPTQPEIRDMRSWLCQQIRDQHAGLATPTPWRTERDLADPAPRGLEPHRRDADEVSRSSRGLLAANEAGLIVAVSRSALAFLGYEAEADLVGRRVITIIPDRYHQAHIAGLTFHMANGRAPLLGKRIAVPVVLADDTEQTVEMLVDPRLLDGGRRLFVAEFLLDSGT